MKPFFQIIVQSSNSNQFIKIYPFLFLVSLSCISNAIAQTATGKLNTYMQTVEKGSYEPVPQSILSGSEEYDTLLEALQTYQTDSTVLVRTRAYNISKRIGQKAESIELRQQAINQQITALDDKDSGIRIKAINSLTGFKNTDFTKEQQLNIINRLTADMAHLEAYARLVGYMPSEQAIAPLKQVLLQTTDGWERFNIQLALTRRGDVEATDAIINRINRATIDDGFVYDVVPELVYSRSEEVFNFLEQIIFSEEPNCSSANPDSNAKILCGYRVMEYIAPAIKNFPIPTDEYGELVVDDYETALVTLREWFIQNPDYQLVKDIY